MEVFGFGGEGKGGKKTHGIASFPSQDFAIKRKSWGVNKKVGVKNKKSDLGGCFLKIQDILEASNKSVGIPHPHTHLFPQVKLVKLQRETLFRITNI